MQIEDLKNELEELSKSWRNKEEGLSHTNTIKDEEIIKLRKYNEQITREVIPSLQN